jgi:hypothetical protein
MGKKEAIAEQIRVIEAALEVIKDLINTDDEATENTVPGGGGPGSGPGGGTGGGNP